MTVDFDVLELKDDQSYWLDGKPFQGVAVFRRADGTIESEVSFEDGVQAGSISDYHPDGSLACQGTVRNGVNHGEFTHWGLGGNVTMKERYAFGICTLRKEFDNHGNVLSEFKLTAEDPNAALLASFQEQDRRHRD